MEQSKLQLDRRDFLQFAALAAAVGTAALPAATANAAEGGNTDFVKWLDSISGQQKVVLDVRDPNNGLAVAWAWVWLLTGPKAYGLQESDVGTAMVFRHDGLPFVFEDAMWKKYKLGEYFKINDPQTNAPALRNTVYKTPVIPEVESMTLKGVIDRGVKAAVCDMALNYHSGQVAKQMGLKQEDVLKDWNSALVPGVVHAPSGVVALQGTIARGCAYLFAG